MATPGMAASSPATRPPAWKPPRSARWRSWWTPCAAGRGVLAEPAAPAQWGERLRQLMADFLLPDDDHERRMLLRLDSALEDWLSACADAGLHAALPLAVAAKAGWPGWTKPRRRSSFLAAR